RMSEAREDKRIRTAASPGSRWAFQIGTLLGIPIRIHATFVFLLVWLGMSAAANSRDVPLEIVFVLALFGCVVFHELGHAAMAKRFGVKTREIVLYPFGGVAWLESIPGGRAELLIALAGPAVNVVIAGVCALVLAAFALPHPFRQTMPWENAGMVQKLLSANVLLVLFNMIPAFPMDGGRVLRAVLSLSIGQHRATRVAAFVGQAIAAAFVVGGIVSREPFLAFIGLFVFLGASLEVAFQARREVVAGHAAREAMITKFETLAPQDTLGRAAELLLAARQHDFPVVDAWGRVAGVLPRATLLEALARSGRETPVLDVMIRETVSVAPGAELDAVLQLLQRDPSKPVLVVEDGALRGMITFENLAEFIVLAQRIAR
ncbi:MAG TPA: site-2 protease family protein, partial [Candidatus Polarisedimenticolaceae bacterium]|nr:site-2 protease family protein [Candidatus Polarisedimenticolaceae bacterium]